MATPLKQKPESSELRYLQYSPDREDEYVTAMRQLISKDLSEPYSIYVYRYFLYTWGDLCFMVRHNTSLDCHGSISRRKLCLRTVCLNLNPTVRMPVPGPLEHGFCMLLFLSTGEASIHLFQSSPLLWLCSEANPCQSFDLANSLVGVVVSKLEPHRGGPLRGYIAMLAVRDEWRGHGVATALVRRVLDVMIARDAEEVCAVFQARRTASGPISLPATNRRTVDRS